MITFKGVHKAFGPKRVLNGLDLEIQQGELFFVLGRSGTGKSVALKHLVGLLRCDQGEIWLDGQRIDRFNEKQFAPIRRKCGLVFQLPALLDSRTILENVTFGIRDIPLGDQVRKAEKMLKEVGLASLAPQMNTKYPPQISYGEQKRVALARTLIIDPSYVLYDEPTTGLDPITSKTIHELIRSVSHNLGTTAIVVSHDMRNALNTADRIAVLDAGKVVDLGTPAEILKSHVSLTCEFLKDVKESEAARR